MGSAVTIHYANETIFQGQVKEDKPHGKGKISFGNGTWI